jgi:hypothetical protein
MGDLRHRLQGYGIRLDQVLPVSTGVSVLFNPSLKSTWYMIPGIAVILVTMVTALLTGFSIVREKEAGTLEQLMVTPLKPIHVVVGKAVPFLIIGIAELMFALNFARFWFGVPFRGSYLPCSRSPPLTCSPRWGSASSLPPWPAPSSRPSSSSGSSCCSSCSYRGFSFRSKTCRIGSRR